MTQNNDILIFHIRPGNDKGYKPIGTFVAKNINGIIVVGNSVCNPSDRFKRSEGIKQALLSANKQHYETGIFVPNGFRGQMVIEAIPELINRIKKRFGQDVLMKDFKFQTSYGVSNLSFSEKELLDHMRGLNCYSVVEAIKSYLKLPDCSSLAMNSVRAFLNQEKKMVG